MRHDAVVAVGVAVCWSAAMRAPQSSSVPREPTGLARESMYSRAASYFWVKLKVESESVVASEAGGGLLSVGLMIALLFYYLSLSVLACEIGFIGWLS